MQCKYLCINIDIHDEKVHGHIQRLEAKKNEELTKIVASVQISLVLSVRQTNLAYSVAS